MHSHCFVRQICLLSAAIGFLEFAACAGAVRAAEPIIVELSDGHVVQGEADLSTDERLLWLRRESAGMDLIPLPWRTSPPLINVEKTKSPRRNAR